MWRNEQTGDWDIGFTEKCAIYDCRLWDYSDVRQKGDKFEVMLTNRGENLKVSVGKLKDGKRQMTIGNGKKQLYSQITTDELPNYPTKDLKPFKDNGYQAGDTVTFIGWLKNFPKEVLDKNWKYEKNYYQYWAGKYQSHYSQQEIKPTLSVAPIKTITECLSAY